MDIVYEVLNLCENSEKLGDVGEQFFEHSNVFISANRFWSETKLHMKLAVEVKNF